MKKGSFSLYEYDDGSIKLSYEDIGVEMFGGEDYEVIYSLDYDNAAKLKEYLINKNNTGTLEEMITSEFGEYLDKKSFCEVCKQNSIEYKLFTWIG